MLITIKTTNHKTSIEEQHKKLKCELEEFDVEYKIGNKDKAVDELIDVAKCALKLALTIRANDEVKLNNDLMKNHEKNEERGYHD